MFDTTARRKTSPATPPRPQRRWHVVGAAALVAAAIGWYALSRPQPSTPATLSPSTRPSAAPASGSGYPLHRGIITTVFWVGEGADAATNDSIANYSSVWLEDWVGAYGGIDAPAPRCNLLPCGFTPKENAFYFALPYNDFADNGRKPAAELRRIPWYTGSEPPEQSVVKNRWIAITYRGKTAYAQWEDAGPFGEDDVAYVFGGARPAEPRAGLDVSPAVADYVGIDGRGETDWQFVDEANVPNGPWKTTITRSSPWY